MIKFNELRISECSKKLIVDVSVSALSYFNNVYIDKIIIDNQDTYIGTGPSSTPIFEFTVPETLTQVFEKEDVINPILDEADEDFVYTSDYGNIKTLRLEIPESLLQNQLNSTLFFVYIITKGTPASNTPCGFDDVYTLSVVSNIYQFYSKGLELLREIEQKCNISPGLIDFILKVNGLDLALKTCNYPIAIKYWNKFFKGDYFKTLTNNCGCNE